MPTTRQKYLGLAISAESSAKEMYAAYARVAKDENEPGVALLFKALEMAEAIHAANHARAMQDPGFSPEISVPVPGTTLDNLQSAFKGETWEYKSMYPGYLKKIRGQETMDKVARLSMQWAMQAEKTHAEMIKELIAMTTNEKGLGAGRFWVCQACGNLHYGQEPDELCPVCKHDSQFYTEVAS